MKVTKSPVADLALFDEDGRLKNPLEGFKTVRQYAIKGDSYSQGFIGYCYVQGIGVRRDRRQAFKWLSSAADQGDSEAMVNLAMMLERGDGVRADSSRALSLYRQSAAQGNAVAQTNLGLVSCLR